MNFYFILFSFDFILFHMYIFHKFDPFKIKLNIFLIYLNKKYVLKIFIHNKKLIYVIILIF